MRFWSPKLIQDCSWLKSNKTYVKNLTLPKTNMDTQNDGLEKVTPFKHGNFWYLC